MAVTVGVIIKDYGDGSGPLATSETPGALRFIIKDGKRILQQSWHIAIYSGGSPVPCGGEWRDVPLIE